MPKKSNKQRGKRIKRTNQAYLIGAGCPKCRRLFIADVKVDVPFNTEILQGIKIDFQCPDCSTKTKAEPEDLLLVPVQ